MHFNSFFIQWYVWRGQYNWEAVSQTMTTAVRSLAARPGSVIVTWVTLGEFHSLFYYFYFFIALLRYHLCTIKFTHFKCTVQWTFSQFMELCSLHHSLILEHPRKKLLAHLWSFSVPIPSPIATNPLPESVDLHFPEISQNSFSLSFLVWKMGFLMLHTSYCHCVD